MASTEQEITPQKERKRGYNKPNLPKSEPQRRYQPRFQDMVSLDGGKTWESLVLPSNCHPHRMLSASQDPDFIHEETTYQLKNRNKPTRTLYKRVWN